MLIAPFSVSPPERTRSALSSSSKTLASRPPLGALAAWFFVGCGVLLFVPATRGGNLLGATMPFWLVVAPLLNLAWVERRRIARYASGTLRQRARATRVARSVRI
jgi:hypothetical protein